MKKFVDVLNRILSVVLVLVLLFSGYIFVTVLRAGKDSVPSAFGYSFLQVWSGSMEPTIETGSLIIVRHTDAASVAVKDVICFYSADPIIIGKPNTHRVVRIVKEGDSISFITKGDAKNAPVDTYPVEADQLIGVYVGSLPIKNIAQVLQSPYFFFFALLVPLCAVIFVEFLHLKKTAEEKRAKAHEDDADEKSE